MASRGSQNNDYNSQEEEVKDDKFSELGITPFKGEYVLCADFDTLIYWTLVSYNEDGSKRELTLEDLPELEGKLNELVLGIFNKIEQYFILKKTWVFIRGKNNYRKTLFNNYKSNRPEKHFLTPYLYNFLKERFNAVEVHNFEAEDACASIGWKLKENCIIAFCDHDLLEIPHCIMYNYQKEIFLIQSEKDALWEKYRKLVIGEAGDFANFTPQIGKKYFDTNFHKDMTIEEYEEASFQAFILAWSDKVKVKNKIQRTPNPEKAEEMFKLAKEILWLKEVDEIKLEENEKD